MENCIIAPFTLFANFFTNKNDTVKQCGKLIAVPVPIDKRQDLIGTLTDNPEGASIVTIVRGNNFNKPVYEDIPRVEIVKSAIEFLTSVNKNFENYFRTNIESMDEELSDLRKYPEYKSIPSEPDITNEAVLLPEGTFAPASSSHPINFLKIQKPYSKILPTFFPSEQDDLMRFSQLGITEGQWVNHMMKNVKKTISENSVFVFASSYRMDMQRLESASRGAIGRKKSDCQIAFEDKDRKMRKNFFNLTGSRDYYKKQHNDIVAKAHLLGYPEVFYTFTSSKKWDVSLATALSQDAYNIWHSSDEKKLLSTQSGNILCNEEDQYYAHIEDEVNDEYRCPYHTSCRRIPIRSLLDAEEERKLLKRNFYNAQRIFDQRLRALIRSLLFSENRVPRLAVHHTGKEF